MRRRKVFTFGLACAVVAALSAASPLVASAAPGAPTSTSIAPAAVRAAAKPAVAKAPAKAPAEAVTWGPWKRVLGGGTGVLSALGCLTATNCFGWDVNSDGNRDLVHWNGSTWSSPTAAKLSSPPSISVAETSCPTSTFCMTVGGVTGPDHGAPGPSAYVYAGGHWTATKPSGSAMLHVSCASPTFCVATDDAGGVSEYNGKTWTEAGDLGGGGFPADDDVSCVSAAFCVLATDKDSVWEWNGKSWEQTVAALNGATGRLEVSCVSSTWCLAVGGGGQVYRYDGSSWTAAGGAGTSATHGNLVCTSQTFCLIGENSGKVARFDGASWTLSSGLFSVGDFQFGPPDLSCAGRSCVAVAQGPSLSLANTFTDGRWTGQKMADSSGTLSLVSCPTTSFCAALGGGTYAETWQHGTWTAPVYLPTGVLPFRKTGDLRGDLSCSSATFCLADDTYGSVWRYNGRTWATIGSPPAASPGITGLACASSAFCVATVTPSTNSKHQPTSSGVDIFNGSRWTAVKSWAGDTGHWQYASCSTTRLCIVSDDFGHVATFNGKSWRQLKAPAMEINGDAFFSCTADFCAVPAAGPGQNYPVKSGVMIFNGRSWTYHYLASGGYGSGGVIGWVSCAPRSTFCVASTGVGRTFSYNGSRWSGVSVVGGRGTSLSCASAKLCMAVDNTGDVAIGT